MRRREFLTSAAALVIAAGLSHAADAQGFVGAKRALLSTAAFAVNFSAQALPSWFTYTGGNGAYTNSTGNLALAATNAPRFDFASSGLFKGIIVEPTISNELSNPNTFTNAAWQKLSNGAGSSNPTVTASFAAGPDGVAGSASRIQFTKGSSNGSKYSLIRQGVTLTGSYSGLVYIKSNTGSTQRLYGITNPTGGTSGSVTIDATTTWQAFLLPAASVSANVIFFTLGLADDRGTETSADVLVSFAMLGLGASLGSYTPGVRAVDAYSFIVPAGIHQLTYTFDDNTTQTVSVWPGMHYTIPTNLNRRWIKTITFGKAFYYDFYYDPTNGSDVNNGLAPSTPKLTWSAISTLIGTSTNKCVGVACGSTSREECSIGSVNGVQIKPYGSGANPIVRGDETISAGGWSKTGGRTNVYEVSLALTGGLTAGEYFVNVYEDGKNLVSVASEALCDSTAGSFYIADQTITPITLKINATGDGKNPATNGKAYEYTKRGSGINLQGDNCCVWGIDTRRQRGNDGSRNTYGFYCLQHGGIVQDGGKHAAYCGPGGVVEYSTIKNCYYGPGSENLLVFFSSGAVNLPGYTSRFNSFDNESAVTPSQATGLYAHTGDGSDFAAALSQGNTYNRCSIGIASVDTPTGTSAQDTFTNCSANYGGDASSWAVL